MADDIDHILEELSASCNVDTKVKQNNFDTQSLKVENSVKSKRLSEDLTDILNELKEVKVPPSHAKQRAASACEPNAKNIQKCSNPMVGGTDISLTEFHAAKICNKLRCLSCDLPVIIIDGFMWEENVDYVFIRTNYPDVSKLHSRLTACRPNRAYACQCGHLNASSLTSLKNYNHIKWICNGH